MLLDKRWHCGYLRCEEDGVPLAVRVDADVGLVRLLVRHERLHDEGPQFPRGTPDLQSPIIFHSHFTVTFSKWEVSLLLRVMKIDLLCKLYLTQCTCGQKI